MILITLHSRLESKRK